MCDPVGEAECVPVRICLDKRRAFVQRGANALTEAFFEEIGRASCRERVFRAV